MSGRPDWRFRLSVALLAPLLAGHGLWQAAQGGGSRLARQKLGMDAPRRTDRPVWLHMSSVGEVNAAQALVTALRARHPGLPLLASTFTPTGAEAAAARFGPEVEHAYLPLDLGYAVRRFLDGARPRCALIMETEIWPRLFHECGHRGIPLVIVNGRLSRRTMDRPAWMRAIVRAALQNVDQVLARSAADAERFRELGVPDERIQVIDNIKFALPGGEARPIALPRPYVVAASTHDDEELRLARAWLASDLARTHLLVIVPRHPRRKAAIVQQLRALGGTLAVRSEDDAVDAGTAIYLADTFAELRGFMAGAALVLMGGSLVPRGGQNVIEPARLGRVALFGPHMENFAEERELLLGREAAIEVTGADEMIARAAELIASPDRLAAMGERARQAIEEKGDIAARYVDALEPWIGRQASVDPGGV